MTAPLEYESPRVGKTRTYPSMDFLVMWDKVRDQVIKQLEEDGYTVLDPYGRPIRWSDGS